jgi:hypothetical protein
VVTQLQIAKIFWLAYAQAATLKTAPNAFAQTEIYPAGPNTFGDAQTFKHMIQQNCHSPHISSARFFI